MTLEQIGKKAKLAAIKMSTLSSGVKDKALVAMAEALRQNSGQILEANKKDMEAAADNGTASSLLDRLLLNEKRIEGMAVSLEEIVSLTDPVGEVILGWKRPNGLKITQVRVPLGVVGVIYEARPNVTIEAAGLSLKSGNAVILRGGSLAFHSNKALIDIISVAATKEGLPDGAVLMLGDISRKTANEFMKMDQYLDVLVPRGGEGLVKAVVSKATVPVLWAAGGNCHTYVDKDADQKMALDIAINAKCQRPGVCNAMETLLIHKDIAQEYLPVVVDEMKKHNVLIHGDKAARQIVSELEEAGEKDYYTEYLAMELAVKIVNSIEEAIDHIDKYGTGHSEAIITKDYTASQKFINEVDAASVYINASTRFTDGGQYGLGAEIGVSTQKLHVRGPMGLKSLTSTKYIIYGNGQVRE